MNYPLISEYVEAIKAAEENFEQLNHLRPVLDEDGEPIMSSGNFALVFKMKDEQTGKLHAVKCFLKEQEGRAEAYLMIAEELEYVNSTFLTPIKYLDKELFVDSKNSDESEFPVLLMDWVEGMTLDKYIREHIDDQYELSLLAYQFSRLAMWLMPQPFAHGDLKPDNILVKDDGTLVLVDYDGMYVPAMKGQKARELGSPDFRHPSRIENDFDDHIDDFSLASILLSLKAISLQPSLLEEYGASDRLLFSEKDYRNLSESTVMDALKPLMQDAELASLYSLYILALSQNNLSQVSFRLFNLNRPDKSQYAEENLSTEVTEEDLANAWVDEYGAKYSQNRKRLLVGIGNTTFYRILEGTQVICDNAFGDYDYPNYKLKKIIIPESVVSIGNGAFEACFSLEQVNIPAHVEYIGKHAFSHCYNINVTIPKTVTYIGSCAFWNCRSLTYLSIPPNLIKIEDSTFANCYSLIFAQIPNSILEIGDSAFADCFALEKVIISDSVKRIGSRAFFECYALREVVMSKSIEHIGNYAFEDCRLLQHIVLPKTLKYLGEGAFECCESLISVDIPDSITSVEKKVFCGCHSLSQVKLPDTITLIDEYAFETCDLSQIVIPQSLLEIKDYAFSGCQIKYIDIPESVSTIGNSVFCDCTELSEVHFSSTPSSFGKEVFEFCTYIQKILIPLGTRDKFELLLPDYKDKILEHVKGWIVKEIRPFSSEEIAAVKRAEVVASKYGNSICFFMHAGGQTYIPLCESSSLSVGDTFDLTTAKVITLCREGKVDIYRVIEK